MLIDWYLKSKTQLCVWTFQSENWRFQIRQPTKEFFALVDTLHAATVKIRQMLADGMDPEKAILEWERIIKQKQTEQQNRESDAEQQEKEETG